ncbi:hypothetical protein BCR42DRAFT_447859 [Absidia repens]|uniref:Pentacotripeptide-repeat region of PRORP domain-containing protein n=1 Tax=Absidia repens TaxID=90262 RepID=A0A1X2IUU9_9FUNG|nr:hypothetical protein BCR42DRAFT_447859 [Absidia repens]
MSSSGSSLCRRLWIKSLCHDFILLQRSRSPFYPTLQQTCRLSSQVYYQPPPTFLTPTLRPPIISKTTTTALPRKALEKMTLDLVKSNHIDDAHRLLTDIYRSGRTPTVDMYNHIIKALAKQFRCQQRQIEAHTLLDDMVHHGVTPNAQTYIQFLLGYALHTSATNATTIRQMQLIFDRFLDYEHQQGYKRTQQKIKKLVEVMASIGHGAILPVMVASVKARVSLDVVIWHHALSGCTKGDSMEAAEQLLEIMIRRDATAYDIVIGGYLMCGEVDRAIELFQRMMDDGIVADDRTYQKFLRAYAKDATKQGTTRTVVQHENQLDTLQRLWQAMMKTMPTTQQLHDDTLVMLLECYLRNKEYAAMEQVYWDLRQHDYAFSRRSVIYFYKAISGFAQQQHLISGIAMFYDLLMHGHGANHSTTSSLLRACVLRGQLDMAQQILGVVEETVEKPAAVEHYTTMLKAYVQQGQLDMAAHMFTKVQQHCEANGSTSVSRCLSSSYQTMIRGYFKAQQSDMVDALFKQWITLQQKDKPKNNRTLDMMDEGMIGVMVEGYGLLGDREGLDEFLCRGDVDTSSTRTKTILIQSRLQQGDVEGAEKDLNDGLAMTDIKAMQSSVEAVLCGMALNGNVASCEYWVDLLLSKGLINNRSYMALLVCYGKAGEMVKLQQIYDDLNQQGIQLEDGIENKVKLEWLETNVYS